MTSRIFHMEKDKALRLAREALERVEFPADLEIWSPTCYWCEGYQRHPAMDQDYHGEPGHKPNCPRQVALAAIDAALNGPTDTDRP